MAKNLRAIRKRIASIKSTQQITKAMKMVAAAKLKRAQDRALASRNYLVELTRLVRAVTPYVKEGSFSLLKKHEEEKKVAVLLYTSNRGLCGAYNSNLIRQAEHLVRELKAGGQEVSLYHVGKKGHDYFKKRGFSIGKFYGDIKDSVSLEHLESITKDLIGGFLDGDFDRVILVYSKFISAASQRPHSYNLLPVEFEEEEAGEVSRTVTFEPDAEMIFTKLLPLYVRTRVINAVLESAAGEQGSRMTAMEAATTNAGEILRSITLDYNKARQAIITQELVEITGSAEAQMG